MKCTLCSHVSKISGVQKNLFLKKAQPTGFWGFYWGFSALLGFSDFLFEQLASLLVDLTHQLSFI